MLLIQLMKIIRLSIEVKRQMKSLVVPKSITQARMKTHQILKRQLQQLRHHPFNQSPHHQMIVRMKTTHNYWREHSPKKKN